MFGGGIAQFVEKSIINDQKIGKAFGASFILLIVLFFLMTLSFQMDFERWELYIKT